MKTNTKRVPIHTHEGAAAQHINAELQLRRSVMACMLWEDEFYESGESIAQRIAETIPLVSPGKVVAIAIEARTKMKLRHVPLLIAREMARLPLHKGLVAKLLPQIIQRADELAEFLSIYWKDGRQKVSAQVKKGLAAAFQNFDEYNLAKYNRDGVVKLRDVLFLCHAKPKDTDGKVKQIKRTYANGVGAVHRHTDSVYTKLVDGKLATPDTWEVALSGGADKKEAFLRLMAEKKLFALAFIRNLRNMAEAGINKSVVSSYAKNLATDRVLPFRFITAARMVPQWEDILEPLMMKCLSEQEQLPGSTVLLLDVSGSMDHKLSDKGETLRIDAGLGLGVLLREICEQCEIFTFSDDVVQVAPRHGFALRDAMKTSQRHNGTYLKKAVQTINKNIHYDRLIVITDEQSHDGAGSPSPKGKGYIINVAPNQNGVGYGEWTHIDGWSESVIDYIRSFEKSAEKE